MRSRDSVFLLAVFVISSGCSRSSTGSSVSTSTLTDRKFTSQGIYGADDRHDIYAEKDASIRGLADSSVLIVKNSELEFQANGSVIIATKTLAQSQAVCADEPFRDQDTAGYCSGFLVAPDTIVTAGHCVSNDDDCHDATVVFGFALSTPETSVKTVSRTEVYRCSRVVYAQIPGKGADFSVMTLDRPVENHLPLRLRTSGQISPGEGVMVIGHPLGLPLKIAAGAKVRSVVPNAYFVANLDTYGGNSGSPVFNLRTREVEGLLVRGGRDFVYRPDQNCQASVRCGDDECRGEDVTLISEAIKYLKR